MLLRRWLASKKVERRTMYDNPKWDSLLALANKPKTTSLIE
jgi:hypothetical protein